MSYEKYENLLKGFTPGNVLAWAEKALIRLKVIIMDVDDNPFSESALPRRPKLVETIQH